MKNVARLMFALLLGLPISTYGSIANECLRSPQTIQTVCNLGWPEGCHEVPLSQTPLCKASLSRETAILGEESSESLKVALAHNDFTPATDALLETLSAAFQPLASSSTASNVAEKPASVRTHGKTVIDIKPEVIAKAETVLKKLESDPLNQVAQGEAAAIIRSCKEKQSTIEMFVCSGFFVPSIVRLNCLNSGSCLPLSWGAAGIPNGQSAWWQWQTYSEISDISIAGIARPWVTTPETAKAFGSKASDSAGKLDQNKFALCMSKEMGGDSAKQAIKCY